MSLFKRIFFWNFWWTRPFVCATDTLIFVYPWSQSQDEFLTCMFPCLHLLDASDSALVHYQLDGTYKIYSYWSGNTSMEVLERIVSITAEPFGPTYLYWNTSIGGTGTQNPVCCTVCNLNAWPCRFD